MRVLVADDEIDIRDLLEFALSRLGHEVVTAPDGTAALNLLRDGPFDVAVIDINMPGMTGLEVTTALRAGHGATPRVLLMSALSSAEDVERGRLAGADDYVTKPFSLRDVAARVERLGD